MQNQIIPRKRHQPRRTSEEDEWELYAKETAEKLLEKEHDAPLKAEPGTPSTEHKLWSITVPVNSLQHDIFLLPGKDETPWMDQVRFDRELTALENGQKNNASQTRATWAAIVNDPTASNMMMAKIKDEFMPQWLALLHEHSEYRLTAVDSLDKIKNTYGSLDAVPAKYKPIAQYFIDVEAVTESLGSLAGINLQAKQKTIDGIRNKNVEAAVTAADDEDRIDLVFSWHEERLAALRKQYTELSKGFETP